MAVQLFTECFAHTGSLLDRELIPQEKKVSCIQPEERGICLPGAKSALKFFNIFSRGGVLS